jgi:hypothetical protein
VAGASPHASHKIEYAAQYSALIRSTDQATVEAIDGLQFEGVIWTMRFPIIGVAYGIVTMATGCTVVFTPETWRRGVANPAAASAPAIPGNAMNPARAG